MKILHILDLSLPDLKGYSIRAKGIVEAQKKIGLEPICLTSFRQTKYCGDQEVINKIKYYRSGKFKPFLNIPFINQFQEIRALSKKICYVLEQEKIDILHAHSPLICGMAATIAGKKYNIPVVYEIRAFWEDAAVDAGKCKEGDLRYNTTRYLETLVCKRVDKVVTICEGLKQDLLERGINPTKISVVPNGITIDEFQEKQKSTKLIQKHALDGFFIIGFIGSFFKFEGVDILVKLMKELKNEPAKLLLVGDGETFNTIKNMIKTMDLYKRVILTGKVSHATVGDYYSVVDVMIYPRYSERITELTTPLKPLEAMVMRKNIIISDVGGLKELVPKECGEIFKSGDVLDLKRIVMKMMHNSQLRTNLVNNAYRFSETRNWIKLVEIYRDLYSKIN